MTSSVEFHIDGSAVSSQCKNRPLLATYMAALQAASAKEMGGAPPWTDACQIDLWIFTVGGVAPENDNAVKVVRDAIQGVVYVNDRQVKRDRVITHDLIVPVTLPGLPARLASLATRGVPFVYVRVTTDVAWSVIS